MRRIQLKRIYEQPASSDGFRVLVDRLWPRGVSKERASLDLWLKEVAPSDELRRWYAHDPKRWKGFQHRYRAELATHEAQLDALRKHKGTVTLLFGARDVERNEAVVLKDVLLNAKRPTAT